MTARVLAIDVTGPGGGAALLVGDSVSSGIIPPAVARARDLVPEVSRLVRESGLRIGDLQGIACAVGPGSFTGIRIGIATAATLAYAAKLPVIGIGSLHGIAAAAPDTEADVAVALNARREHVFGVRFVRKDGHLVAQGEYRHVPAAAFSAELDEGTYLLGDVRAAYPLLFDRFRGAACADVRPDAIARLGAQRFADGRGIAPAELRPLYLRLSDPEIRRQAQSG
jgi:tRNA threonylcarbamoyladenosine biosynthesis protein TsaB